MHSLIDLGKKQKIAVMVAVLLSMFLSALDQTIVSTSLPTIVREFNALDHLSWVFTAYMLTSTITVPIYGRLSDLYGRKKFFLASIAIFLLGSALCGMAQDMGQLIMFRAFQGIGGGAIMTNAFSIIGDLFPPAERGKWQGVMGGVFGLSSVIGPFLGGWLTDNVSWRWTFYINMPIGIIAFLAIIFLLPTIRSAIKDKSIDYLGAIYLSMGLITLLLGLVWGGNEYAWNSEQIILLFAFAFITLSFFIVLEGFVKNPIIPMELFKNSTFTVSVILSFMVAVGMFGVITYIPLFAQQVVGVSSTNSGTILFPMMLSMIIASLTSGQIISRTKRNKWIGVCGLLVSSLAIFSLCLMDENTTQWDLIARMFFTGIGMGLTMPVFNIAVQNAFDHSRIGVVTASAQLFRSVGGTVGVAIMGAVLNYGLKENPTNLSGAITSVFFVGLTVAILGFFIALFLKEIPLREHKRREPSVLEELGLELAVEEGMTTPRSEPIL